MQSPLSNNSNGMTSPSESYNENTSTPQILDVDCTKSSEVMSQALDTPGDKDSDLQPVETGFEKPAAETSKRKRVVLSIEDKLEVCKLVKNNVNKKDIMFLFNISRPTITDICKREASLLSFKMSQSTSPGMRTMKRGTYHKIDSALFQWYMQQRQDAIVTTGPDILEKAKEFCKVLYPDKVNTFKASPGYLQRFCKRFGIKSLSKENFFNDNNVTEKFEDEVPASMVHQSSLPAICGPNSTNNQCQLINKDPFPHDSRFNMDQSFTEQLEAIQDMENSLTNHSDPTPQFSTSDNTDLTSKKTKPQQDSERPTLVNLTSTSSSLPQTLELADDKSLEETPSKRKRVVLSIDQKLEVCEMVRNKVPRKDIMFLFNVSRATISDICKHEDNLRSFNIPGARTMKRSTYHKIDSALFQWYVDRRQNNVRTTGPQILDQAKVLCRQLYPDKVETFKASPGYLHRFCKRFGIKSCIKDTDDANTLTLMPPANTAHPASMLPAPPEFNAINIGANIEIKTESSQDSNRAETPVSEPRSENREVSDMEAFCHLDNALTWLAPLPEATERRISVLLELRKIAAQRVTENASEYFE